jgi:hypothetical protein
MTMGRWEMKQRFDVLGRWILGVAACCLIAPVALAVGAVGSGPIRSGPPRLVGRQADLAAAHGLIARLAVLRRAQTAADVLPSPLHLPRFSRGGVIIASLSRLVASTPSAKLFLVVITPPGGPRPALWGAKFGDQVAIVAVTAAGASESVGIPAAELANANQLEPPLGGLSVRASAQADQVGIVPDGVARVSWTFAKFSNHGVHSGRVVSLPVSNNVAVIARDRSTALLLGARWYAADGTPVSSSDRALRQATAARDATIRRQIIVQDAHTAARPSPLILADFAVFAIHSRTGLRIPGGIVISKPSLTMVPLPILEITSGGQPPQLDPDEMRQVTTRSGFQFWVIPGHRGLCVAFVDSPRPPLFGGGAGEGCSGTVRAATSFGAGLSSGYPGGRSVSVRLLPNTHPTITVRTRDGRRRTIRPPYGIYVTHTGPLR